MGAGSYDLDQVVVYDYYLDRSYWMTPAEARRYIEARLTADVIDEIDPSWEYHSKQAGPKPKRTITPELRKEE